MGGFCPICMIYWGGFCPRQQKRVGGILSGGGGGGGGEFGGILSGYQLISIKQAPVLVSIPILALSSH